MNTDSSSQIGCQIISQNSQMMNKKQEHGLTYWYQEKGHCKRKLMEQNKKLQRTAVVWGQHCLEEGGTTAQVILHPTESAWQCSADCKVHSKTELPAGLILLWDCNFPKYSTEEPTINVKSWPQIFLEAEDNNYNPPAAELEKGNSNLDTVSSYKCSMKATLEAIVIMGRWFRETQKLILSISHKLWGL